MAWIKVETSVARNRKFVIAGPAPSWLWLCGLAYCQEGLTDGFIATESLEYLGVKNPRQLAAHLVKAGLWDVAEGGWRVHDYLAHNKSAATVRGIQDDRHAAGARGGTASGASRRERSKPSEVASADTKQTGKQTENTVEASVEPRSDQFSTEQNRTEQREPARSPGPRTGLLKPPRPDAAFDGGRVWVLHKTHADFLALRGNDKDLREWYAQVAEEWTHGASKGREPGANMFKFWEARYAEKWPVVPAARPASGRAIPEWATRGRV